MFAKFIKSKRLVALGICALAVTTLVIVTLTNTNPISEIEKLGGEAWYPMRDWVPRRFNPVESVSLGGKEITDNHLVLLRTFKKLDYLGLEDTQVTDEGIKELLRGLPVLNYSR